MATPDRVDGGDQRREARAPKRRDMRRRSSWRRRSCRRPPCRGAKSCSSRTIKRSAGRITTRSRFRAAPWSRRSTSAARPAPDVAVAQVTTDRDSTGDRDRVTVAARLVNTGAAREAGRRDARRSAAATCRRSASICRRAARSRWRSRRSPCRAARRRARCASRRIRWRRTTCWISRSRPTKPCRCSSSSPRGSRAPIRVLFLSARAGDRRPSVVPRRREERWTTLTPRDLDGRALVVLDEVAPPAGAVGDRLARAARRRRRHRHRPRQRPRGDVARRVAGDPAGDRRQRRRSHGRRGWHAVVARLCASDLRAVQCAAQRRLLHGALLSVSRAHAAAGRRRCRRGSTTAHRRSSSERSAPARSSIWASTLDSYWTNLPLQPVFLPFVHQLGKGRRAVCRSARVVHRGRSARSLAPRRAHGAVQRRPRRGQLEPSSRWRRRPGARERVTATGPSHLVTLREQGFYELRGPNDAGRQRPADCGERRSRGIRSVAPRSAGRRRRGDAGERTAVSRAVIQRGNAAGAGAAAEGLVVSAARRGAADGGGDGAVEPIVEGGGV